MTPDEFTIDLGQMRRTDLIQMSTVTSSAEDIQYAGVMPVPMLRISYTTVYHPDVQLVDYYAIPLPVLATLAGQIQHWTVQTLTPQQRALYEATVTRTREACDLTDHHHGSGE